jgi:sugar transferase (PEP-CTERM/EpsH1 system associated)
MDDLLFLAHRIPYPPNKGDKIRSWHILRHLAQRFRVHLGCFVDDPDDWRHRSVLEPLCASVRLVPLGPARARLRSLAGLATGDALSLPYYRDRRLSDWVAATLDRARPGVVFAFSSTMAQYLPPPAFAARRIVDLVDVDSEKWRAYAERMPAPRSWIYAREARTLLAFERRVAAEADTCLFVSAQEADLFRRLAPEVADRADHLWNGVDTAYFSPERDYEDPFAGHRRTVVFTGAMGYWPNVEAACRFAREILPRLAARVPDVRFAVVGADPAAEVRALATADGATVRVTGRVEDVRPYIAHAAACVAPMRIARGVQNKVLEAMAMARPVVVSPEGLAGIEAVPGRDVLVADGAEAFADALAGVLERGAEGMGARARRHVAEAHAWPAALARLDAHLGGGASRPMARAG